MQEPYFNHFLSQWTRWETFKTEILKLLHVLACFCPRLDPMFGSGVLRSWNEVHLGEPLYQKIKISKLWLIKFRYTSEKTERFKDEWPLFLNQDCEEDRTSIFRRKHRIIFTPVVVWSRLLFFHIITLNIVTLPQKYYWVEFDGLINFLNRIHIYRVNKVTT